MESSFGHRLRELRRHAGLSQRRLAETIGVDFSYISKLENDRLPAPAAETVVRLATAVGVPAEDLLAVARKIPNAVGDDVVREPAAIRFLQTASTMKLSGREWETLIGKLESLREEHSPGGDRP